MSLSRSFDLVKQVIDRLLTGETLRAKALFGGAWLGGGSVAEQTFRFSRNILLARLLAPGAFGTMAIVMSAASLVDTLTNLEVKGAIIQNPRGAEANYLNAAWWLGMGRAFGSYFIFFALAPWISRFYGHAELSPLLRVALASGLLNGAMSPRSIIPQREMKFSRWVAITNGGAICGVILTIILSFFLRDVWALAIGYCSENAFRCILSYLLCPGFPALSWDWRAARELLMYSRGVFGLSFLNVVIGRADVFVLARLYSPADLGFYTMAVSLIMTPLAFLTGLVGQILFPALSRVQSDTVRLNRIIGELTMWIMLAGLPLAVSISLSASSLLKIVYGARYATAAGPLAVAAAVAFFTVVNSPLTCTMFAIGRPALHRFSIIASALAIVVAIYPACRLVGTVGGQIAVLIAIVAGYLFQLSRMSHVIALDLVSYVKTALRPLLAAGGVLGLIICGHSFGLGKRPAADLTLCFGSSVVVCAIFAAPMMALLFKKESVRLTGTPESVMTP